MLEKLIQKAELANMRKSFNKGLMICPSCGNKAARMPTTPDELLQCASCASKSLAREWLPAPGGQRIGHPDQIPVNTRIQREGTPPGECIWNIPATGKFGFFLFFGLIWTAFTAFMSSMVLFGSSKSNNTDALALPFLLLFFGVFWAVGLGMLYAAIRSKYATHRISVTRDKVTLRRELFGRSKEKSLPTADVTAVAQVEFYQQNDTPIYGVEIRAAKKKLRFGSAFSDEEKAWLAADIKRAVFGEAHSAAHAAPDSLAARAAHRQSAFSFPFPAPARGMLPLGIALIVFGTIFFGVGLFANNGPSHCNPEITHRTADALDWFFRIFSSMFNLVFCLFGFIAASIGFTLARLAWTSRNQETRLEGDDSQISIRTFQQGRLIKERSFPRSSVTDVRTSNSGHANNKIMKRIDLIVDGKAERITRWTDGELADAWANDVRKAIG